MKWNTREADDELGKRLKAGAAVDSPRFSPAMHERIMKRIVGAHSAPPPTIWRIWPVAFAAAALMAAGVFRWSALHKSSHLPEERTIAVRLLPSVPPISSPVREFDQLIVAEWTSDPYSRLDRDGEQLVSYLGRQLDVTPPQERPGQRR